MSNSMKLPPKGHASKKAPLPPEVLKFQRYCRAGGKELELAHIYLDDGALASGAAQLRRAATLFDKANVARNTALSGKSTTATERAL